ncbi:MAG TPA: M28 family peptidase [Anaerolineae bacterium]|nr:M28 family peptidase [Anaerolineae bacterium]
MGTPIKELLFQISLTSLVLLACCLALAACDGLETRLAFDGENAFQLAAQQLDFGPRHPGSEGHEAVGDWILAQLQETGWEAIEQPFLYRDQSLRNIIGVAEAGEDVSIILGAHYDTRPIAEMDLSNPELPVPGANDGASGVAVLLELARVLRPDTLCAQVSLVFFDAEDSGEIDGWDWAVGSEYFVETLEIPPQAVVIVDMVGDEDLHLHYERNSDSEISQEIWSMGEQLGYPAFIPQQKYSILDDHTAFLRQGIPAVDIIDFDYPYWHTTQDTLEHISAYSLEQVGRTLEAWLQTCP